MSSLSLAPSKSPALAPPALEPAPLSLGPEPADFGSNAARAADLPAASAPSALPWLEAASAPAGVTLTADLRRGARGGEVKTLQAALGVAADGVFGPDTRAAVRAFQRAHGLVADGIVGPRTRAALARATATAEPASPEPTASPVAGGPTRAVPAGLRSPHHDDAAFVPAYPATAYSESASYRTEDDPYAVGAITRPRRDQDLGGKTYGTYQFESSVYRDGTRASDAAVENSTVMRFVRSEGNPYGAELAEVVARHGVASAAFDAKWRELTARDNRGFGRAQERFVEAELRPKVDAWMDAAGVPPEARQDPRLFDLVIGTLNQYGTLADGMARHVARSGAGTADEVGATLQGYKRERVESHFRSSPKAHAGIHARIAREAAMFDPE